MEFGERTFRAKVTGNDFDVEEIKTHHRDTASYRYSEVCNNHKAIIKYKSKAK